MSGAANRVRTHQLVSVLTTDFVSSVITFTMLQVRGTRLSEVAGFALPFMALVVHAGFTLTQPPFGAHVLCCDAVSMAKENSGNSAKFRDDDDRVHTAFRKIQEMGSRSRNYHNCNGARQKYLE